MGQYQLIARRVMFLVERKVIIGDYINVGSVFVSWYFCCENWNR